MFPSRLTGANRLLWPHSTTVAQDRWSLSFHGWERQKITGSLRIPDPQQRTSVHVIAADFPNLPLTDYRHRLVACQRSSGHPEVAEAKPRTDRPFCPPTVLLHNIV
jgi:hypothetical protein